MIWIKEINSQWYLQKNQYTHIALVARCTSAYLMGRRLYWGILRCRSKLLKQLMGGLDYQGIINTGATYLLTWEIFPWSACSIWAVHRLIQNCLFWQVGEWPLSLTEKYNIVSQFFFICTPLIKPSQSYQQNVQLHFSGNLYFDIANFDHTYVSLDLELTSSFTKISKSKN